MHMKFCLVAKAFGVHKQSLQTDSHPQTRSLGLESKMQRPIRRVCARAKGKQRDTSANARVDTHVPAKTGGTTTNPSGNLHMYMYIYIYFMEPWRLDE